MDKSKLEELRKVAEAAVPGPWTYVGNSGGDFIMAQRVRHPNANGTRYHDLAYLAGSNGIDEREGKFISTFNPSTVIELLDTIKTLREALEQIRVQIREQGANINDSRINEIIKAAREAIGE